jgi:hypothetical protein
MRPSYLMAKTQAAAPQKLRPQHTISPFEALRQSLDLPPCAMVGDAIHFLIGEGQNVVAVHGKKQNLMLIVELADMSALSAADWQKLVLHLSDNHNHPNLGRLMVMDNQVSMAWSHPTQMNPAEWVAQARQAMHWAMGAREIIFGKNALLIQNNSIRFPD